MPVNLRPRTAEGLAIILTVLKKNEVLPDGRDLGI